MTGRIPRGLALTAAATLLAGGLLTGCSGDSDGSADTAGGSTTSSTGSSPSESPEPTTYLPVPEGVALTDQGSALAVGETASVAWEPRQDTVGVLDVTVTKLVRTTFEKSFVGWKLDDATKKTTPYFVSATITNTGATDVGGQRVPLYAVDATNTLIEASTFKSTFKPCPSKPFPKAFAAGATADVCLVYLAPDKGELTAVSFRPTQEFDPITWTGTVEQPKADGTGKKGKNGKGKNKQG